MIPHTRQALRMLQRCRMSSLLSSVCLTLSLILAHLRTVIFPLRPFSLICGLFLTYGGGYLRNCFSLFSLIHAFFKAINLPLVTALAAPCKSQHVRVPIVAQFGIP